MKVESTSRGSRNMNSSLVAATIGVALLAAAPLHAAEWKHEVAPYLWGAAISGTTAVGPVEADVDASFSDILDNLEMGFMGTYRASRDRVSVTVDGIYMGLGGDGRGPAGFVKADVDLDQSALEVDVGYEVLERLTVFGGLRYNDLSVDIRTTGPLGTQSDSADEDWVDPVIGAHYTIRLRRQVVLHAAWRHRRIRRRVRICMAGRRHAALADVGAHRRGRRLSLHRHGLRERRRRPGLQVRHVHVRAGAGRRIHILKEMTQPGLEGT